MWTAEREDGSSHKEQRRGRDMAVGHSNRPSQGWPRPRLTPDATFALVLPRPAAGQLLVGVCLLPAPL